VIRKLVGDVRVNVTADEVRPESITGLATRWSAKPVGRKGS
jgi:hypothetical protein